MTKKRSASKERESKCNESRCISKLRSLGSSCWNTPGPEVEAGYGVFLSTFSEALIVDSKEERKVLGARGVCSSEEPVSQRLSMLNPKPRLGASFGPKTDANDTGLESCS